jgi:type II secretory pathway component PulF
LSFMFRQPDRFGQLDYVTRQVARLMARDGCSAEAALALVESTEPEGRHATFEQFRNALSGADAPDPGGAHRTLWQLLMTVRGAEAGRVDQCILTFVRHAQLAHTALRDVVQGLRASTSYSAALLAVLLVVAGVMEIFVMPSFTSFYKSIGASLPPVTRAFVDSPWPLLAMVVGGATLCIFSAWLASALARSADDIAPLPRAVRVNPLLRDVSRRLENLLYLQYLAALLNGAVPADAGRAAAARIVDPQGGYRPSQPLAGCLDGAAQLELLGAEVGSQLIEQMEQLSVAADTLGRRVTLLVRLIIYAFVAAFVLAMYQPIFQLCSAF